MPFRQLHFDEGVFGANIESFNAERFLNRDLVKSPSWRPFGGAATLCPGRFIARREIYLFVALVLQRFEIGLVGMETEKDNDGGAAFPRLDEEKPTNGIMGPRKGHDIHVRLRRVER